MMVDKSWVTAQLLQTIPGSWTVKSSFKLLTFQTRIPNSPAVTIRSLTLL